MSAKFLLHLLHSVHKKLLYAFDTKAVLDTTELFFELDSQHCRAFAETLILDLQRSMFMESSSEDMLGMAEYRLRVTYMEVGLRSSFSVPFFCFLFLSHGRFHGLELFLCDGRE
jgi:hypothetical protein